jgi:hypothetical protein
MGAVCYKPKGGPIKANTAALNKQEILRAISDKAGKETIGDTEMNSKSKNFDLHTST